MISVRIKFYTLNFMCILYIYITLYNDIYINNYYNKTLLVKLVDTLVLGTNALSVRVQIPRRVLIVIIFVFI